MRVVLLIVIIAAIIGWIMNVIEIFQAAILNPVLSDITLFMIMRIVGIFFFPIGAILGYF